MALLDEAFRLVTPFAPFLALLAWPVVFLGAIGMALVLRRVGLAHWRPALAVGLAAVAGHTADIYVTLKVSPDLGLEGNPLWVAVAERLPLPLAIAYGISGQALVCVLSFELFAWYLATRERLFPARAESLVEFVKGFGKAEPRRLGVAWRPLAVLFAWIFSLLGPYFFYVAFLNARVTDEAEYARWPSPPVAIVAYLVVLVIAFGLENWRAFNAGARSGARAAPPIPPRPPS